MVLITSASDKNSLPPNYLFKIGKQKRQTGSNLESTVNGDLIRFSIGVISITNVVIV